MDDFENLLQEAMTDPEFKKEYDSLEPEYALIEQILELRQKEGLTQAQLAERIGIQQSHLSRLESGNYNPSLAFLKKVAKGMGKKLILTFR
ncbi:MAG: helix-turn-helix domain-containing protein [Planctomycetia bacterium]|nr:helix-turn-helix domain-containing protein [Planctomycetia bacterium]